MLNCALYADKVAVAVYPQEIVPLLGGDEL